MQSRKGDCIFKVMQETGASTDAMVEFMASLLVNLTKEAINRQPLLENVFSFYLAFV